MTSGLNATARKIAKAQRSRAAQLCALATLREIPAPARLPQIDLKRMQNFSRNRWENTIFATSVGPQEAFTVAKIERHSVRRFLTRGMDGVLEAAEGWSTVLAMSRNAAMPLECHP